MNFNTILTDSKIAAELLSSPMGPRIQHVLSISDLDRGGGEPPIWFTQTPTVHKVRLLFDDVEKDNHFVGYKACTYEDIKVIQAFGEGVKAAPGLTLIHCGAGISRSSASTFLVFAIVLGEGQEARAAQELLRCREWSAQNGFREDPEYDTIHPNRRIMWMGDALLGRKGVLWAEYDKVFGQRWANNPFDSSCCPAMEP